MPTKTTEREAITQRFKAWLESKRLTPEEFSRQSHIHFSTVMKWYMGENGPSEFAKERIRLTFPGCPIAK